MQEIVGENNRVCCPKDLKLDIRIFGDNNTVDIDETCTLTGRLVIFGNNTVTKIGKKVRGKIVVDMGGNSGRDADFCQLLLDDNISFGEVTFQFMEKHSKIHVGKNCIFAKNIFVFCSDTHSVVDLDGNLLNYGRFVDIGEHVWVGRDVHIGKNVSISKDTVIGWNSVVTKSFEKTNCILAGNPAKIVKENINWNGNCPDMYLDKNPSANIIE